MISMARTLGAPVTEPQGNSARSISLSPMSDLSSAEMPEVIWCTER